MFTAAHQMLTVWLGTAITGPVSAVPFGYPDIVGFLGLATSAAGLIELMHQRVISA